jgi:hypothetical protein
MGSAPRVPAHQSLVCSMFWLQFRVDWLLGLCSRLVSVDLWSSVPRYQLFFLALWCSLLCPLDFAFCPVEVTCLGGFSLNGVNTIQRNTPQIRDHALPQRGFGLSTPIGAVRRGATPSKRRRRQRESRQRATHEPRSEHTGARWHTVVCYRSSNQEKKGGNNGAHSITPGAGTTL